jgi:hypothetical protein
VSPRIATDRNVSEFCRGLHLARCVLRERSLQIPLGPFTPFETACLDWARRTRRDRRQCQLGRYAEMSQSERLAESRRWH